VAVLSERTPDGAPDVERQAPRLLGLRRAALLETLALLAVLLAIDWGLLAGDRFALVSPHPFWLVVLLITTQYGTGEGLVAALFATLALLTGNLPEQRLDQDLYQYVFRLTVEPTLWFVAAVTLGELQGRRRRERDGLQDELAASKEREATIAQAYRQLDRLKQNLEARVAGQLRTVFTTYTAAKSIEKLGVGEVLVGISELVRSVMNPEKFSLYLLNGSILEAAANEGWSGDDRYARDFDAGSLVFESVVGRRQFLCAAESSDDKVLAGEGVLAGPLTSVETGQIVGMLKIEQLGFLDLNPTTIQNFRILCDWIGTAFANAERYEESQNSGFYDPLRNLLSASFFDRQSTVLAKLAQRVGFDLCVLFLRVELPDAADDERLRLARKVSVAADRALRTTDLCFDYRQSGWDYAIILPNTNLAQAAVAAEKLVASVRLEIGEAGSGLVIGHSLQSLHSRS
jgi:GGDEF domain-containing protein